MSSKLVTRIWFSIICLRYAKLCWSENSYLFEAGAVTLGRSFGAKADLPNMVTACCTCCPSSWSEVLPVDILVCLPPSFSLRRGYGVQNPDSLLTQPLWHTQTAEGWYIAFSLRGLNPPLLRSVSLLRKLHVRTWTLLILVISRKDSMLACLLKKYVKVFPCFFFHINMILICVILWKWTGKN